jgi:hypothetical protein
MVCNSGYTVCNAIGGVKTKRKVESRKQKFTDRKAEGGDPPSSDFGAASDGRVLVTSRGLAAAFGVSLRTIERMLRDGEIQPVWVRDALRFHVPDVIQQLVAAGAARKNGRKADGEKLKTEMLKPARTERAPVTRGTQEI